ncbi:MAG: cell surface protein [Muribaculaceae bacterium]|nr:cell surface protein [Muribaculaceae bacterium]
MKGHAVFISLTLTLMLASCTDDVPMVSLGLDSTYRIERMRKLMLAPAFTGRAYRWTVDGVTVSEDASYIFMAADEGTYHLTFDVIDSDTPYHHEFTVDVLHEEIEYSPYISQVYEYCPAPGQFINEMPRYDEGDTSDDMTRKVQEAISGTNDVMVSLGAYGGYVTFGFDHTVVNVPGQMDFRIWGNCFYELLQPDRKGGSCEPGIVMVSYDVNCNGLPDDAWYELAGSEYHSHGTRHGFTMAYHAPDPDRVIAGDDTGTIEDKFYIRWAGSDGTQGYIPKNIFHTQDYYPAWVGTDKLTFTGSLLAPNAEDISGIGTYYVLYSYAWGYADNHPNDYADLNSFDIGWAVDANGVPVSLPGVDFVRVYTGVNQYCGWLGETSTEICRAQDLHISAGPVLPPEPL